MHTSGNPDSLKPGKGRVVGSIAVPIKPGSTQSNRSAKIFDEETRDAIYQEYQKEKEEHPELPQATVYKIARDHVMKERGLEDDEG